MMRNDYRRALILLRSNAAGYSGHVRLERRTLMGSMYFLLQAPMECETLRAALVGRGRDSYHACAIGEMQRDSRGQAVLTYNFDPRNICSRELEQYQLIAITCAGDANCEIVLYGNVCGHADLNWERVRTALCGLYSEGVARETEGVQALPEAGEAQTLRETREIRPIYDAGNQHGDVPAISDALKRDTQEEIREEIRDTQEDILEDILENDPDRERSAGEALGIDMTLPWPESIEPLRSLFALSVPMENPPDDEYVYIAAAMPPESGYAYSAVGVRVQDGVPVSVRYGLPAPWSPQPPAGLEEYTWVGNQNYGWWMTQIDQMQIF